MMATRTRCSWRCEAEEPRHDTADGREHEDCPDPHLVCGIANCYNEKYPDDEYCDQCDYELRCDDAMDAAIDAARMDA